MTHEPFLPQFFYRIKIFLFLHFYPFSQAEYLLFYQYSWRAARDKKFMEHAGGSDPENFRAIIDLEPLAIIALRTNGMQYWHLSDRLKSKKHLLWLAMQFDPLIAIHVSGKMQPQIKIYEQLIVHDFAFFRYKLLPQALLLNHRLALIHLQKWGWDCRDIPLALLRNKHFLQEAAKIIGPENGCILPEFLLNQVQKPSQSLTQSP